MGYDYLVNLYRLEETYDFPKLKQSGIRIIRILSPNFQKLEDFIKTNFSVGWANEVKAALYKANPSCFIAVKEEQILGFAAYDATAKGYFGPIGVAPDMQGYGLGKALLLTSLVAMRYDGYGYAIIGSGQGKEDFYQKCANAVRIEDDRKNVYDRLLH